MMERHDAYLRKKALESSQYSSIGTYPRKPDIMKHSYNHMHLENIERAKKSIEYQNLINSISQVNEQLKNIAEGLNFNS
jgi:hypothetical protein